MMEELRSFFQNFSSHSDFQKKKKKKLVKFRDFQKKKLLKFGDVLTLENVPVIEFFVPN